MLAVSLIFDEIYFLVKKLKFFLKGREDPIEFYINFRFGEFIFINLVFKYIFYWGDVKIYLTFNC